MAIIDPEQHVSDAERTHSLSDEKYDEKNEKNERSSVDVAEPVIAEVYDDVRAIDLDDNGKERPIGDSFSSSATRLLSYLIHSHGRRRCYSPHLSGR
jgi:hypothetical protein